nr:unnamed protein product [Digitaria exilis]
MGTATTAAPHVMVLPFPGQGHVTPLMELSHRLVDRGFQVTFVNTEPIHALVLDALRPSGGISALPDGIRLVSVPDGLAAGDDRRLRPLQVRGRALPVRSGLRGALEQLIRETKVKWLVRDVNMGMCFEAAVKLGVRVAAVFPAAAACLGALFMVPQLIEDGFFDNKGQEVAYRLVSSNTEAARRHAEIVVCNSFRDAEAAAFELFPSIVPVGPLFADAELCKPVGQLLPEDTGCMRWLDAQPDRSVVYVAFGSFAIFDSRQFKELAEGLELTGRPFLWVVRPDFTNGDLSKAWFDEFQERVAGTGMVVSWCPQQQVLAHCAVACFMLHCGWSSTMEGVRNGMPFLCWPYFVDQFANRSYICDIWRTGLAVSPGEDGIVTKEQVSVKVAKVIGDEGMAERARMRRDAACKCLGEGGSSRENFSRLVDLLRE